MPIHLVRALIGVIALFFAHFLGRSAARLYDGVERVSRLLTWVLRTAVAVGAVVWSGGFDAVTIIVIVLAAAAFLTGAYLQLRPRKVEPDPSREMFPKD